MLERLKDINFYYGNLLTFGTALILIVITVVYTIETHKQANASNAQAEASNAIVQDAKERANKDVTHFNSVKTNYIFQINAEMLLNSYIYVNILYYCLPLQRPRKYEAIKLLTEYGNNIFWMQINVEAARYLPKNIMEEIVGYYIVVQHINGFWKDNLSNHRDLDINPLEDIIKAQLMTYLKCLEMMEKELGRELRKVDKYEVNDQCFKIDKDTGMIEMI